MNTFGRKFRVSIFGESHGELIGVTLDGVPAGLELCEADFHDDILRRKSGAKGTTPRIEEDLPMIVSCSCCETTMVLPSAMVDDDGYIYCGSCAE